MHAREEDSLYKRLTIRISVLIAIIMALSMVVFAASNSRTQWEIAEGEVLTEARTLGVQMQATWDYIDQSQSAINYNSDGSFDFKGIYCSMAGKSIAQNFTRSSEGYVIRYARQNPRSATDVPDAFEAAALEAFEGGRANEYYEVSNYDGREVFRYASAIEIKWNCLSCHGSPAGEPDVTGFIKEGMELGDLAGIVSIVIPLDSYKASIAARSASDTMLFFWLVLVVALTIYFALRHWVAKPLSKANIKLRDENEAASNFLTIMSHEMRTPLSSIMAYTDVLEGSDDEGVGQNERRFVQEIRENSRQLLGMVDNTIDVARLEAGAFEISYDEVDMVDLVNTAASVLEPLAAKQGIAIVKEVHENVPVVFSDWDALYKIASNLLGNAVKYTKAGGCVRIAVDYAGADENLAIVVEDSGIGIAEEDFEAIFERFSQASEKSGHKTRGSGLGLFLVKSLAEELGGTVKVESVVGEGSVFTVVVHATTTDRAPELLG